MTIKELIEKPTLKFFSDAEIKIEKADGYLLGIAEIDHNERCALIFERYENRHYTYYMALDETI